jgi:hypothetical protein
MLSRRRHLQYKAAAPLESHKESSREVLKEYESATVELDFLQLNAEREALVSRVESCNLLSEQGI